VCGITFSYSSRYASQIASRTEQALSKMQHRGPDAYAKVTGPNWGIGHRRLSILDLGHSHQPMQSPDSNFVLSFNGEIYNFKTLRDELSPHWQFKTSGDTEVLLAGLIHYGPSFLRKLRGMWALALWNSVSGNLLLARDRIGKKPLYYTHSEQEFTCASELPALFTLTPKQSDEDLDSTADFFSYGFYMPGKTAYSNISEILPGHYATWNPSTGFVQQPYWELKVGPYYDSHSNAVDDLRSAMTTAVERRLVSDVEVGLLLSGGIDSSLIAAILTKDFERRPKSFTVGFGSHAYDERDDARRVAVTSNTNHYERVFPEFEPAQLDELVSRAVGQPFGDASLLPTSCAYALAGEHVKVVLSGDGADELFSGYQRYQARLLINYYLSVPKSLRVVVEKALSLFDEPHGHHSRSLLKKAKLFARYAQHARREHAYIAPDLLSRDTLSLIAPDLSDRGSNPAPLIEPRDTDDVMEMMSQDALIYLPQDILTKVDRASMTHSVESRCPFLDAEVVDLAFRLPRHWNRRRLMGKRMIRDSFSDYLPPETWKKRKQGFSVPLSEWFCGELGNKLLCLLSDHKDHNLSSSHIETMLEQHRAGITDNSMGLWAIYSYLKWKLNMKPEPVCGT